MKKNAMLKMCKILHKITLFIGVMVTILSLLFWSHIPDKIPVHYGATGKVDRIGSKEELILLFFILWLLMGVFSIVSYYLKTSGVSKYASEQDEDNLHTVYPMMTWTALVLVCIFAYMIITSILERNLGVLFLPITFIAVLLPVGFYIGKEKKIAKNDLREKVKFLQIEKQEKGISYRTAVDWWLALIFISVIGMEVSIFFHSMLKKGRIEWITLGVTVFVLLLIIPLLNIKYIFYSEHLLIKAGWLGKERISYSSITNVKETHNPLSAPACSLNRIQVDYVRGGRYKFTLISPVHLKTFRKELESRCEK